MITLALIGVGRWGGNYIRTIEQIPDIHLKYLCAKSTINLKKFSEKYITVTNHNDLNLFPDIDGIIIASPASTHFSIATDFASSNFHLLIEKPITTSYKDALTLQKIYRNRPAIVMVGHIYLYHPAFKILHRLIKNIGKIQYMVFEGMQYGPIRSDISCLWDWSPHDIAMMLDILQKKPLSVSAWGNNDMCHLKITFDNDLNVFIHNGWLSPVKKRGALIVGEKDAVLFDDTKDNKLTYFHDYAESNRVSYPEYSSEQSLTLELQEFISCIQKKQKPKTNLQQGVDVVRILEASEKSMHNNGKEIKLL